MEFTESTIFKVGVQRAGKQFQVSYQHPLNGKRVRAQFKTRREAEAERLRLEARFRGGNLSHFLEMTIEQLVELHTKECPETRFHDQPTIRNSFMQAFSQKKLRHLNSLHMKQWFESLNQIYDYSPRTLQKFRACINHFFRWLIDKRVIFHSPMHPIRFPKKIAPRRPRVILSESEIKEMLTQAKDFSPTVFYPYLVCMVHTGARRGEIATLQWKQVDFATGLINLHKTKTGESRSIKMADSLHRLLNSLPRESEYVFTNQNQGALNKGTLQYYLRRLKAKYLHEKNWNFHSLRHSFAHNFLKKGGEMYQLQAILGHASIQMTVDLYGQLASVDVENPSPYEF